MYLGVCHGLFTKLPFHGELSYRERERGGGGGGLGLGSRPSKCLNLL